MKKILILGAGKLQVPAILEAKNMGLRVIVFDYDKNAPGSKLADEFYEISTIDINKALEKSKEVRPDAVMTLATDMPLRTVAAIADELHLNAISIETAFSTTNKAIMRQKLKEDFVPIPNYFKVTERKMFNDCVNFFKGNKFIVKPADNSGSRGVYLCDASTDTNEVFDYSMSHSRSGEIVIEEYMTGREVSVETFAVNGHINIIAITDKVTTGPPYFVELQHTQPSSLSNDIQNSIKEVAVAANKALKIENGPSHVEIIVTDEGPKVVELGARLGGDNISTSLVPLSTGVNLVKASINLALNRKPDLLKKYTRAATIQYLNYTSGTIVSINGERSISKMQGVYEFTISKHINDTIPEIKNSNDRIGYFICEAATHDELCETVNHVLKSLRIEVQ